MAMGRGNKLELTATRKQGFAEKIGDYRSSSNMEDRRTNPMDTSASEVLPRNLTTPKSDRPSYSPKSPRTWDNQVKSRDDTNSDISNSVDEYVKKNFKQVEGSPTMYSDQDLKDMVKK